MAYDNSGQAFPVAMADEQGTQLGMSLRDYFAAAAMQAIIAKFPIGCAGKDFVFGLPAEPERFHDALVGVTTGAYAYADAMLLARQAEGGTS